MKYSRIALLGLSVALVSATAWAASGAPQAGNAANPDANARKSKLAEMDLDGNGKISAAEANTFFAAKARTIDANHDGVITIDEMKAYRQAQREQRAAARFAALDTNGDGKVSDDEFAAAATQKLMAHDRDGNGEVATDEVGRHRRHQH